MNNPDISILVISCSLYKNIWDPFFELLQKNWPDCPYDIYLGTDKYTGDYSCSGHNIKLVKTQLEPYAGNYSNRTVDFLSQINSKYVIIFQDDHLIDSKVITDEITACYSILEQTQGVYNGIRLHGVGGDCGLGSADSCEGKLTNIMKENNIKMLAIADDRESPKRVKNIIPYIGIGAINGGIVNNNNMDFLNKEGIPVKVYDKNCIYDKSGTEHKFNKDDEYYINTQKLLEKNYKE
jgi:hypothetical protein